MRANQIRVGNRFSTGCTHVVSSKIDRISRVFFVLAIGCSLAIAPAAAQNRNGGEIRGTVTDASGAVIPGASVEIRDILTGVITNVVTDTHGIYDAASLIPGTYSVSFSMQGFKTQSGAVKQAHSARS